MGFSDFIKKRKREFFKFSDARDKNLQDVFLNVITLENPALAKQVKTGAKEAERALEKLIGIYQPPKKPKQSAPPGYTPPTYEKPPRHEVSQPYLPIDYGGSRDKITH